MTYRFVRGPSKQSHLVLAWGNLHIFVWRRPPGMTVRYRRADGWTHIRIVLWQHNATMSRREARAGHFFVRPTLTPLEIVRWRTAPGVHGRVGLKAYIRLKVGPGGRTA